MAALERRVTLLWATVAAAPGHEVSEDDLIGPVRRDRRYHPRPLPRLHPEGVRPSRKPGFAEGASSLAEFIARARETGQLREWMSGRLSALGDFLTVLGNLAQIVYTVLSAANSQGAGLLQTLRAATGSMLAFLRFAEGTVALQQFPRRLGAIAAALLPLLAAIGRVVASDITPAIAQLGSMVAAALGVLAQATAPPGRVDPRRPRTTGRGRRPSPRGAARPSPGRGVRHRHRTGPRRVHFGH